MKAIIDGKRYDTDAKRTTLIAENGYGYAGDFRAYHEGLYVTGKGNFFTAGSGGPMTHYAERVGNNTTSGSEKIIPMTRNEAREWLERFNETEALEEYFADDIKDA